MASKFDPIRGDGTKVISLPDSAERIANYTTSHDLGCYRTFTTRFCGDPSNAKTILDVVL
jgi:hypothetical protein